MMRSLTVFIAAMLLVSSDGFSYSRVLPSTSNPRAAQRTVVAVDTNVIIGCAVGLAGIAGGVGVMSFAEKQAIRTSESGALSDETKTKMSAKFMEDVEMNAIGLDDTLGRMEQAMAKRKGVSVGELNIEDTKKEVLDDGW
mmetsp:Transcript_74994/g.150769  ORF Transcript_74994/g.150769 Transcript_74994/m.150769 type:complete len:140 (-) Transcript_74994:318-737(-)